MAGNYLQLLFRRHRTDIVRIVLLGVHRSNTFGCFRRDIPADLGLVARVPGSGVEHSEALP